MPSMEKIDFSFDWKRLEVALEDWEKQDRQTLFLMLQEMYLIREFENTLLKLKEDNLIHGPVHTSVGQEAVAVGTMHALHPADLIAGTHRAHHQFLARALTFHTPKDYNPLTDSFTLKMQEVVNRLMAEIMGLAPGYCSGRGGSMHLRDSETGILGTDAIVAGGIPIAAGAAWAERYKKRDGIVVSFFGDGAVNQGVFHEALNLAGLWKLPIIYIIENNLYAVATNLEESLPIKHLSLRAASYGMKALIVDGMNPIAVKTAVEEAAMTLSHDKTPVLIEAMTYRFFHHAGNIPGSKFGYRGKEEEEKWKKLDPLRTFPQKLEECSFLAEEQDQHLKKTAEDSVRKAVDYCTEEFTPSPFPSPTRGEGTKREFPYNQDKKSGARYIRVSLLPKLESLTEGLHSDGSEFDGIVFVEADELNPDKKIKYVEAIAEVTKYWLEKNPDVFVIGEEVGHFGGGAYQATRGLPQKYPDRILNTPISEAGFCGFACGAAICGLKPIVEIMFPDFALVAADQIFNQIGKLRYIYGGKTDIPLVMRTRIAIGCGYGGQHSMDPVALFALFPGWRIAAPTTPFDYIGLFNSAMQSNDPVLIVEHHELYNKTGFIPSDNCDYYVRMGKAKKLTEGKDITVLAYSSTVALAKQAAEELSTEGISAEVIDLRTLDFANIDYETIGNSLQKTSSLLIVEQAPGSNSIGAAISHECTSRFFDYLDCPAARITGADIPIPVSKTLESAALPTVESVKENICRIVRK